MNGGLLMSIAVKYNNININYMSSANAILNGDNTSFGYSTHQKSMTAISIRGDSNLVSDNHNLIYDPDYVDTHQEDSDYIFSVQGEQK
jgi:hypothetical protein